MAAAFMINLGDFRITDMHGFLGIHQISYIGSTLLTFIVFMGIVNAMNLIDGIDGLAAGIAFLATCIFGLWFFLIGEMSFVYIAVAIIGTLLAYLGFNVFGTTNKIFMGDKIETGAEGQLQILLLDQTVFTLGSLSAITVDEFVYDPGNAGDKAGMVKGIFRAVSGKMAQRKQEDVAETAALLNGLDELDQKSQEAAKDRAHTSTGEAATHR